MVPPVGLEPTLYGLHLSIAVVVVIAAMALYLQLELRDSQECHYKLYLVDIKWTPEQESFAKVHCLVHFVA